MKKVALLAMLALFGCASDAPKKKPKLPYSFAMPEPMELLHGSTVRRDVGVNWEPAEREDLEVSASVEPDGKGVSATVPSPNLPRGAGPVQVELHASETAAPGEYLLTLTARGKSGESKGTMTLKVPRKE